MQYYKCNNVWKDFYSLLWKTIQSFLKNEAYKTTCDHLVPDLQKK